MSTDPNFNTSPYIFMNKAYYKGQVWPDNVKDGFIAMTRTQYPGLSIQMIAHKASLNSQGSVGQKYAMDNPTK